MELIVLVQRDPCSGEDARQRGVQLDRGRGVGDPAVDVLDEPVVKSERGVAVRLDARRATTPWPRGRPRLGRRRFDRDEFTVALAASPMALRRDSANVGLVFRALAPRKVAELVSHRYGADACDRRLTPITQASVLARMRGAHDYARRLARVELGRRVAKSQSSQATPSPSRSRSKWSSPTTSTRPV
jgi:hypothetical protein